MIELLERLEARTGGQAKAKQGTSMPRRGSVYSEMDVAVTVKISTKELGKLLRQKKLTVKARDANKEPHTYTVTIELGKGAVVA